MLLDEPGDVLHECSTPGAGAKIRKMIVICQASQLSAGKT